MIVKLKTHRGIPDDWHEHVVTVWMEDDACRAAGDDTRLQITPNPDADWCGRTRLGAWKAITGQTWDRSRALVRHDGGDWIATLFPGGWVHEITPEGEAIGIAVEVRP